MVKCASCGKAFGGIAGFDAHRVGKFVDSPPDYGRRCLSDAELISKGLRKVGEKWVTESRFNVWASGLETLADDRQ